MGRRSDTVVDVHTHFVPDSMPSGVGRHPLWPSIEPGGADKASVMVGGKLFRAIDSRSWDPARRLSDMHEDGVDIQVVSPMPELLSHWFSADDADALADHVNAGIARMCAAHPAHFIGIGMVAVQDPGRAARRIEGLKALGMCGVEIGTHIDGTPLGHPSLDDVYAAVQEADLALMIHPLRPAGMERLGGRAELAAVAAFPLETALAATSLLTNGVADRFPRLRILLSHGGGALPWILPRLRHAHSLGPPLDGLFARDPAAMARSFFYDTVLYDPAALRFLTAAVGEDRLLVGSDYPFTIKQDRPGEFAAQALGLRPEVFATNAMRFLNRTLAAG